MNNFVFQNQTRIYFGKGVVKEYLAKLLEPYGRNVMIAYGGGSVKKNRSLRRCSRRGADRGQNDNGFSRHNVQSYQGEG